MRKFNTTIIAVILSCICLMGYNIEVIHSDIRGFSAGFQLGEYEIEHNGEYSSVLIDEIGWASIPGEPELPIASEFILMNEISEPAITITFATTETIYSPPPNPTNVPLSESGQRNGFFPGESHIYRTSGVFPDKIVEINHAGVSRGYRLGLLSVNPVRYDFQLGAYLVHRKIEFEVDLGGEIAMPSERLNSAPFARMMASYVFNGNVLPSTLPGDPGTYVIITPDNCWSVMEEFAQYKRTRGHKVIHKRLSELGSPPSRHDIKNYVQDLYNTENPAPTFMILVGDVTMNDGTAVPDYNYGYYYSGHGYSLLEGDDYFSDLFFGRWSIDNINECRIYSQKVRWYETTPTSGGSDWLTRATVIATYDHAVSPVWNVLWVRELLLSYGYSQVDTFFERGSIVPSPAEISAPINAGLGIINYRGWAGSNGWWEPQYTVTDVMTLNNSQAYPVVTSIVCGTGDYGAFTDPCFGEAWLRAGTVATPRGGAAFFGTTDHDTNTRYNNPINGGFYTSLFVQDLPHMGQCEWIAKAECLRLHPREYSHIELYFHSYGTLGDPGLMMQRFAPGILEVSHDVIENGALVRVDVAESGFPVEDATVCMYRLETGDFSFAHTDFMGKTELYVPGAGGGRIVLTVYAPFHTTYVDTVEVSGRPGFRVLGYEIEDTIVGNGNGLLDPNEIAVLRITVENYSFLAISPVEAYLWVDHRGVFVRDEFDSATIEGFSTNELVFTIETNGEATGGGPAVMQLLCDSRNGRTLLPITIPVPRGGISIDSIRVNDSAGGDGDWTLEPGESGRASVLITNHGAGNIDPFAINLYSTSGWVSIPSGDSVIVPTIPPMSSVWSNEFDVSAHDEAFHGYPVGIEIHYNDRDLFITTQTLKLGTRNSDDPMGSDAWGYFAYDHTDIAAGILPGVFEDISATGTFVSVGDDENIYLALPFEFIYYGESYDTITVNTNGWAAPGIQPWFMLDFYNLPIPAPNGPWGTLAVFWDDLNPRSGGGIYYQDLGDRFIVQWQNMGHVRHSEVDNTFQIALFDQTTHPTRTGDSEIEFRYTGTILDLDSTGEYSTVGIESPDHGMGIEYLFTAYYDDGAALIDGGTSIKFTTNCGSALITGHVDLEGDVPTSAIISTDLGQITRPKTSGDWRLLELPAGDYVLTCKAPYHFPRAESLSLIADEHAVVDYALNHIPTPAGIDVSQGEITEIRLNWMSAPSAELPFSGYRLLKYNAPGGLPEIIETSDTFYIDDSAETGRKYFYRVQFDYSRHLSLPSQIVEGWRELNTSVDETELPKELSLNASPNPFNAVLRIEIEVPEGEAARLDIFDVLGRRVYETRAITGRNVLHWKGDYAGAELPSGVYFLRISTETKSICKRAVLLK